MINLAKSALVIALASPLAVFASDGVITFDGVVTSATCSINGGQRNFGVKLPSISTSSIKEFGETAGWTPFKVVLGKPGEKSCTNGRVAHLRFEKITGTVDYNGYLLNQLEGKPGGASGFSVLIKDSDGIFVDFLQGQYGDTGSGVQIKNNTATLTYSAGYFGYNSDTKPGLVKSTVQYSVTYN